MRISRCDVCKKDIGIDNHDVVYTLGAEGPRGYRMWEYHFHWDCLPIWLKEARGGAGDAPSTPPSGTVPGQVGLQGACCSGDSTCCMAQDGAR